MDQHTPENVEKAVLQFYQDASSQQEINKWLMAAQMSPQAWTYPWPLLVKEKPTEVQFFGAITLHVKISRFWNDLNAEQIGTLRNQLLDQIAQHATGPRMVLTRLCIALSSLLLQACPELWPDGVSSIISTFQQQNLPHLQSVDVCMLLLEILTVLPEEFATAHLANARIGIVRNELRKGIPQVLTLIDSLLRDETPATPYEQCLKCLCSWVQFGILLPDIQPLIARVFGALSSEAHFDTAVETLVQTFLHPDTYKFPKSIENMLPYVLGLQPMWQRAVQQQDMDSLQGLAKLIVTVADQNTKLIIAHANGSGEQRHLVLSLVNMVLMCTGVPGHYPVDECCSDLPFGFWYNLQDEIIAADRDVYLTLVPVFCPVYMSLVSVLLQKVQYPADEEYGSWNSEEKESHRCYRQDIADTLMYAYGFLHEPLLGNLCQLLAQILTRSASEQVRWQEIESVLYAVSSVAESVDIEECVYLPDLFQMLARIPFNHHKLISTALYLIGAYAEWISSHPEVLSSVIPLLLQGVVDARLAQPATLALKDVLRENQPHIKPFLTNILSSSKQALDSGELKPRDAVRLMSCLGYALSVIPVPEIMEYLNALLAPHIQQLQQISQNQVSAVLKVTIQLKLNMLSWLFSSLNIHWDKDEDEHIDTNAQKTELQPIRLILEQFLPVLHQVLTKYMSDSATVECACDMLKRAVRTLMADAAPLYQPLTELNTQMYTECPNPAILDLSKQLLVLFSQDNNFKDVSKSLFDCLCIKTLSMFENGTIHEHPDILEAFMSFVSQIAKKNSQLLCENAPYGGLFQAGMIGMSMPEGPTVKCSCQFLVEFIGMSGKVMEINDTVKSQGQRLVEALMRAIGGDSPRAVIDTMADVFLALNKFQFEMLCQSMRVLVEKEDFPNNRTTQAQKQEFAKKILKERANKRNVKMIVQEYTLMWRGLIGTEYAVQTQRLFDTT